MKVTVPMTVDDTAFQSSNISEEATYSAYNAGTTYDFGDYVYVASTHRVYRSTQGSNTGNDPAADDGTWWAVYYWTNRWKSLKFTGANPTVAEDGTGLFYEILASQACTEVAFKGLKAAAVDVVVKNASAVTIYSETQVTVETIQSRSWYISDAIFTDVPIDEGFTVEITIDDPSGDDVAEVGQILMGYTYDIGDMTEGTEVSYIDYGEVEQEENFGEITVTPGNVADTLDVTVSYLPDQGRRLKAFMVAHKDTPCLVWLTQAAINRGLFVFGYMEEPDFSPEAGRGTLEFTMAGLAYEPGGEVSP